MNHNSRSLDIILKTYFYLLLMSPVLAYIYTAWLHFPDSIIRWYQMYILVAGIIFIIRYEIKHIPSYTWLILGYAIYRSVIVQFNYTGGIFGHFYVTTFYFATVFMIIIIYNTNFSDKFVKNCTLIFGLTAIIAIAASIIQIFNPQFLNAFQYDPMQKDVITGNLYTDRRLSIFGYVSTNELGLSFIPFSSVVIGHLFRNKVKLYLYLLIVVGVISFLSNNRYCMIGFALLAIQFALYNKRGVIKQLKYIPVIVVLIITFYFILHALGYDLLDWYHKRLLAEGSIEDNTRYKAWSTFIYFFPKYFLWGTGVFNAPDVARASRAIGSSQIHVGYLAHLVSFGIVGSFFYFGFLFMLAKNLFRSAKMTNYWGAFFALLIFLWSEATLVYYSIFLPGIIFALVYDKFYSDKYRDNIEQNISENGLNYNTVVIKSLLFKKFPIKYN